MIPDDVDVYLGQRIIARYAQDTGTNNSLADIRTRNQVYGISGSVGEPGGELSYYGTYLILQDAPGCFHTFQVATVAEAVKAMEAHRQLGRA